MKTKMFFLIFVMMYTLCTHAQTTQDTSIVTIKTRSGGQFAGQIISENSDSIKINTKDLGIVTIAVNEILNQNLVNVETKDGNEFLGEILREDDVSITLKTKNFGEIRISKSNLKTMRHIEVQQIKDDKYWFPNPQSTRYFWSPNGYGLEKGEGYYQNIWVLWNQFAYGVTNNFSLGGGIIPTFFFGAPTPVFATMKFSIPVIKDKINLSAGAIAGYIIGENDAGFGILYGLGTFGSKDANVTVGLGYGFAGGEWTKTPLININGMFRVSSRGYIITENYVISGGDEGVVLLTFGGRTIIKKAALDYGLFVPVTSDGIPFALPWLGFTVPFGNKK